MSLSVSRRLVALGALFVAAACTGDPESLGDRLPEVKRRFQATCSRCHSLEIPLGKVKTYEGWLATVQRMQQRGAELTPQEVIDIARYLALTRGR